jgi:hypothetical protein
MGNYISNISYGSYRRNRNLQIQDSKVDELNKQIEMLKEINRQQKEENHKLIEQLKKSVENKEQDIKLSISMDEIEKIADEMIANREVNINYLPDFVEKQLYLNIFRLAINIVGKTLSTSKIELLGHDVNLSFVPKKDD